MSSALYRAVCFGNTNPPTTHKHTVKHTVCIPTHNAGRMYEQRTESSDTFGSDTGEAMTFHSRVWPRSPGANSSHRVKNDESPLCVYSYPAGKNESTVSLSGLEYEITVFCRSQCTMVLLHHTCLSSSVDAHSFWLFCELCPVCVCLSPSHSQRR